MNVLGSGDGVLLVSPHDFAGKFMSL